MNAFADDAFVEAFEACTLPAEAFHHRDHVRLAYLYLQRMAPAEALVRFSEGLKRYAASLGAAGLYHETITWAFLLLISQRRAERDYASWDEFAAANGDLLTWKPSILDRYYPAEVLASELARRVFILPLQS